MPTRHQLYLLTYILPTYLKFGLMHSGGYQTWSLSGGEPVILLGIDNRKVGPEIDFISTVLLSDARNYRFD